MKKLFLLLFILNIQFFPQQKYFIYFKDKGIKENIVLNKNLPEFQKAISGLSERSIERRKKNLDEEKLIDYTDIPINEDYIQTLENNGIKILRKLKWFNAVSAYLNENQINEIKKLSFVAQIEKVKTLYSKPIPETNQNNIPSLNKPQDEKELNYGSSLQQLNLSDIPKVHSKGIDGNGVIIGILDSGFDWKKHESLKNAKVIAEYDFVFDDTVTANQSNDVSNQDSHGTYVFSILGGFKDGTLIGSAYNASFVLAKTEYIPTETHTEEDNYAAALEWMDSIGVDITSSSLGYNTFDIGEESYTYEDMDGQTTIVTRAAELAFSKGILTVTAAGNEGNAPWYYIAAPADGFNTIAVGAVNTSNILANFSSHGPTYDGRIKPDILAMGVSVYGATAGTTNQYHYSNGTSSATPIASGIAGILLSAFPHLKNYQMRNILIMTADNYSTPNNDRGYGLASALKAITFPNLELTENYYRLHKIFPIDNIDPTSVKVYLSRNGSQFDSYDMTFDSNFKYYLDLPQFNNNDEIKIYFKYSDNMGNKFKEPSEVNKTYNFLYFSDSITNITKEKAFIPETFILEQNYPNPFNGNTKINFYSPSNVKAELTIYNILGEKIKTLFNGIANVGLNQFEWDGKNDFHITTASGFYYYVLNINGNSYSKKMIYLK